MNRIGWLIIIIAFTSKIECNISMLIPKMKVAICSIDGFVVYAFTFLYGPYLGFRGALYFLCFLHKPIFIILQFLIIIYVGVGKVT